VTSYCPEGCCETMAILMARVSAVMLLSSGSEGRHAGVRWSGWVSYLCACGGDSFIDCSLANKRKYMELCSKEGAGEGGKTSR
jgi:hypothetical protein